MGEIQEHCKNWRTGHRPLLIFPEGTTTNGQGLIKFKQGAFLAGAPVRPLLLVYTGAWDPASTNYVATDDGLRAFSILLWASQYLSHLFHPVHIRVLAPYVPNATERARPRLYAQNVHDHMNAALKRVRRELNESLRKKPRHLLA